MTSKEAIDELNTIKVVYSNMRKEYLTCVEALDMAIEALETQERQAIIAGSYLLEGEENVPDTNVGDIECGEKIERSSAQPERPRGEWINISDGLFEIVKCDQCGRTMDSRDNFCPRCGSDMRGEQDEYSY